MNYSEQFVAEDAKHVILECDGTEQLRREMYECIQRVTTIDIVNNILYTLLGRDIPDASVQETIEVWKISCKYISRLYWKVIANRTGIG